MTNPLIKSYRKPALYVGLPSAGKYYKQKPNLSVDGEIAVYAMTARDELISKTPDALFNGEATITLIKSCVPDINFPGDMPVNDLLILLLAIRNASYGDSIDVDVACPKCNHLNQLGVSSSALLSTVKPNETPESVELENGFKVYCKPYTLNNRTQLQIQRIKQAKLIQSLENEDIPDEERQLRFGRTFVEIADLTVKIISDRIVRVRTNDDQIVEDFDLILDWLETITKKDYDAIKTCVENLSESNIDTHFNAKCIACNHTWTTTVDLDIANFFVG
jgi:phage FluMu protein Com